MKSAAYARPDRRRGIFAALWPSGSDAGIEHPTLVRCGLALLFAFMILVFLPDPVYSTLRFIVNPLTAVWVGLALIKTRCRLRFTFPYYMLLLLQVWMVVCMLQAEVFVSKPWVSGEYLWYPVEVGIPYLLASYLFGLSPGVMRYVINFFIMLCGISASVAILQAAHVPPAIHLADFYVYRSIEGWGNVSGIRASGLTNNPNNLVLGMIIAASLIAFKSTKRELRWYDWALWTMFIGSSFLAQHRSSMPILAVTFIATGLVMARKRPRTLVFIFGGCALCLVLAMTVGKHTFGYVFDKDWTNSSELNDRFLEEGSAIETFKQYPLGVGPAPAPEDYAFDTDPKFDYKIENLPGAILLTLGAPGMAIIATAYFSAFFVSVAYFLKKQLNYPARIMGLAGAIGAFALIFNANVQVNITQFHVMFLYMILMALVQFTLNPQVTTRRRVRVSPYLQPGDHSMTSSSLASIN